MNAAEQSIRIPAGRVLLDAALAVPEPASGVVLFAHGSGSSRHSPRNRYLAAELQRSGLATVLADLLTSAEEQLDAQTGELRFDIGLLARRVTARRTGWPGHPPTAGLPAGLFGAALVTAAVRPGSVAAVISHGGRPDLAGEYLRSVHMPTLLAGTLTPGPGRWTWRPPGCRVLVRR
jgi:predicted alpha/beta-hydrolase family hydrolase